MLIDWTNILKEEGHEDWTVKEINSGGGLCVFKTKEIWLDSKYYNKSTVWFLHELAHIKYSSHDSMWANHFTRLVYKYMEVNRYVK